MIDFSLWVITAVAFGVGFGVGQLLCWFRGEDGKVRLGLTPHRRAALRSVGAFMVGVVFLGTIGYTLLFTLDQRRCNNLHTDRVNYRAQLADQDRDLVDQRDTTTFDLMVSVYNLTTAPNPGSNADFARALERFISERKRIDAEAKIVDDKRNENPLPYC